MAAIDIFNPTVSVIANGLEGKIILIYGGNSLGKSYQACRFPKPYVIATEYGLNGISGVPYGVVNRWSEFTNIIRQFTTNPKAREMYSTIIVDEVYAASLLCQDYVCQTYGDGALTLADGDSKHNLYQIYEKIFFKEINKLVNSGFTLVFIAHQQADTQTGYITPKGDKRSINPIIDKADYTVFVKSNGVDSEGNVIKSSAFLAQTSQFFARSRIEYTPTFIPEFTAENLEAAIQRGIDLKAEKEGAKVVSYAEQSTQNKVEELDFDALMTEFSELIKSIPGSADTAMATEEGKTFYHLWQPEISDLIARHLGKGMKIKDANKHQAEAVFLINEELKDMIKNSNVK